MDQLSSAKMRLFQTLSVFMAVLCLVGAASLVFIIKANKSLPTSNNTISVEGRAERYVEPDIAKLSFSVSGRAVTVAEAQKIATDKINAAVKYLKDERVADKDVKTSSYQVYPEYKYYYAKPADTVGGAEILCYADYCPPPYNQEQKVVGYRVEQSIDLTIRDIKNTGTILAGLGTTGIQNLNGPSFEIENYEKIAEEVKNEAIKDARAKAKERAKSLGVSLGKLVNVSDGYYGGPIYAQAEMGMAKNAGFAVADGTPAPVAPELPTGQNKIMQSISVVYEIN